jgi:NAD(P)H-nitrite reductase large subunit
MSKGIKLALGKSVTSFAKGEGNAINCTLNDQSNLETELIILSIGVRPDTKLAKEAGL